MANEFFTQAAADLLGSSADPLAAAVLNRTRLQDNLRRRLLTKQVSQEASQGRALTGGAEKRVAQTTEDTLANQEDTELGVPATQFNLALQRIMAQLGLGGSS